MHCPHNAHQFTASCRSCRRGSKLYNIPVTSTLTRRRQHVELQLDSHDGDVTPTPSRRRQHVALQQDSHDGDVTPTPSRRRQHVELQLDSHDGDADNMWCCRKTRYRTWAGLPQFYYICLHGVITNSGQNQAFP